ncbi:MAG: 4-(cytidine 5'-diphospho)-2-C-methyl-D-erythritol kinase [Treponema sp.]|jgi:4-diphosphocytidyl-2-C-methyl-D-erythritol kinase|nr:4-(cytidine 5'-diphospho)-2-C-methyl-D-erythritol kinase [Treponema sp.]
MSSLSCSITACCKINLHLNVKNKRPDGFHEIESLFSGLDFGDSLRFELAGPQGAWELFETPLSGEAPVQPEKNLVSRAAALFREKTGFRGGIRCFLTKRVPAGAGLGGGSSDGAAALKALNLLAGTGLGEKELEKMAAVLGSDVPFFVSGRAAWVTGRGEIMQKTEIPGNLEVLLVKPPFSSGTAEAYRRLDESRLPSGTRGDRLSAAKAFLPPESFGFSDLDRILKNPPEGWPFFNSFLPVLPHAGSYRDLCQTLKEQGAVFSGLSGSGSCCFGLFRDKKTAHKAELFLKNQGIFVFLTFFVAKNGEPVLKY